MSAFVSPPRHYTMTGLNTQQDALHGITREAHRLLRALGPASPVTVPPKSQQSSPNYRLMIPLPSPITPLFIARGYDSSAAEMFNRAYLGKASSLKQVYEEKSYNVVKAYLDANPCDARDLDRLISATHSAYIHRYNQAMQVWQAKVDEILRRQPPSARGTAPGKEDISAGVGFTIEKRYTFKNETVPLLEKAFSFNAYPSRSDKEGLAAETDMEYKQVNIWFQNRRARSKKEGLSLRRTATFATQLHRSGNSLTLPELELRTVDACGETQLKSSSEGCATRNLSTGRTDFFALISRPAHAFPNPFPSLYIEDPFPITSGAVSFQTPWLRRSVSVPIQKSVVDVEHLTSRLASLSLSSDPSSGRTSPIPSFMLVLPRAPLPALIRRATALSRAKPLATLASATGLTPVSKSMEPRKIPRAIPARIPRLSAKTQSIPPSWSSVASGPIQIPHCRTLATGRSRRSKMRSPSPRSSRSSSLSSITSSRSASSSWSVASSDGPLTPISTSPRSEVLSFKDSSPTPHLHHVYRSSNVVRDGHISSR